MIDLEPAPGWWLASDGRWYPPELHPDIRALIAQYPADRLEVVESDLLVIPDQDERLAELDKFFDRPPILEEHPLETKAPRERRSWHRVVFGVGGTMVALGVILYLTNGRGGRPSLATTARVAATAPTTNGTSSTAAGSSTTENGAARTSTTGAPSTSLAATNGASRVISVFDLAKSNCVDSPSLTDGLVTTLRVVDCAQKHTHEVFYAGQYTGSTFDANKLNDYANDTCLHEFQSYVGIDYDHSRYQYMHIVPTQDSWTRDDDRGIVCLAFDPKSTITGSVAGTKL